MLLKSLFVSVIITCCKAESLVGDTPRLSDDIKTTAPSKEAIQAAAGAFQNRLMPGPVITSDGIKTTAPSKEAIQAAAGAFQNRLMPGPVITSDGIKTTAPSKEAIQAAAGAFQNRLMPGPVITNDGIKTTAPSKEAIQAAAEAFQNRLMPGPVFTDEKTKLSGSGKVLRDPYKPNLPVGEANGNDATPERNIGGVPGSITDAQPDTVSINKVVNNVAQIDTAGMDNSVKPTDIQGEMLPNPGNEVKPQDKPEGTLRSTEKVTDISEPVDISSKMKIGNNPDGILNASKVIEKNMNTIDNPQQILGDKSNIGDGIKITGNQEGILGTEVKVVNNSKSLDLPSGILSAGDTEKIGEEINPVEGTSAVEQNGVHIEPGPISGGIGDNVDKTIGEPGKIIGDNVDKPFEEPGRTIADNVDKPIGEPGRIIGDNVDKLFEETGSIIGDNVDKPIGEPGRIIGDNVDTHIGEPGRIIGDNVDKPIEEPGRIVGGIGDNVNKPFDEPGRNVGGIADNENTPVGEPGRNIGGIGNNENTPIGEQGRNSGGIGGSENTPTGEPVRTIGGIGENENTPIGETGRNIGGIGDNENTPIGEPGRNIGGIGDNENTPIGEPGRNIGGIGDNENTPIGEPGRIIGGNATNVNIPKQGTEENVGNIVPQNEKQKEDFDNNRNNEDITKPLDLSEQYNMGDKINPVFKPENPADDAKNSAKSLYPGTAPETVLSDRPIDEDDVKTADTPEGLGTYDDNKFDLDKETDDVDSNWWIDNDDDDDDDDDDDSDEYDYDDSEYYDSSVVDLDEIAEEEDDDDNDVSDYSDEEDKDLSGNDVNSPANAVNTDEDVNEGNGGEEEDGDKELGDKKTVTNINDATISDDYEDDDDDEKEEEDNRGENISIDTNAGLGASEYDTDNSEETADDIYDDEESESAIVTGRHKPLTKFMGGERRVEDMEVELKRASSYSWVLFFAIIMITLLFITYLNKNKFSGCFASRAPKTMRRKKGDEEKNLLDYEYE